MRIELRNIRKSYDGKVVLDGFSAAFEDGSAYLVTGPSGVGKTTLLRIMLGLEKPDDGEVLYFSDPEQGACDDMSMDGGSIHPELPLHAGVVFQEDRLFEDFSAVDNTAMIFKTPDRDMIRRGLGRLLPKDELDKPVRELSGGMRRRVCIVRACLAESDILVMDEPFNGLDDVTRDKCISYIREMQRGRTLVIVSHLTAGLDFCRLLDINRSGGREGAAY